MKLFTLAFFAFSAMLGAADVTGKWSGTFYSTSSEGEPRESPVLLVLKQDGAKITGTGGRDSSERYDILEGKIEGNRLTMVLATGASPVHFVLTLAGDELSGDASRTRNGEKQTARILTKRVKETD